MTPRDNTDGRNTDFWARNRRSDDYELLCKNGRRAPLSSWKKCNLAKVSFPLVTRTARMRVCIVLHLQNEMYCQMKHIG